MPPRIFHVESLNKPGQSRTVHVIFLRCVELRIVLRQALEQRSTVFFTSDLAHQGTDNSLHLYRLPGVKLAYGVYVRTFVSRQPPFSTVLEFQFRLTILSVSLRLISIFLSLSVT